MFYTRDKTNIKKDELKMILRIGWLHTVSTQREKKEEEVVWARAREVINKLLNFA